MADCVTKHPGLRVPGAWDGFETAVRGILGQQITVVAARKLAGKMVERFGEPLPKQFARPIMRFPRAVVLAGADIASLGMPKARARAIASLAASVVSEPDLLSPVGELDENVSEPDLLSPVGELDENVVSEPDLLSPVGELDENLYSTRKLSERAICPMELQAGLVEGRWTPHAAKQATWVVSHLTPSDG